MFKPRDSSNKQKMEGYSFQHILRQNLGWFLPYARETSTQKTEVPL